MCMHDSLMTSRQTVPGSERIKSLVVQKMTSLSEVWVDREIVLKDGCGA